MPTATQLGSAGKAMLILTIFIGIALHSSESDSSSELIIVPIPNPTGGEDAQHGTLAVGEAVGDSDDEEPTGQNTDFPRLPVGVISDIASIPLLTGIHYSDVFKRINEVPGLPDADIEKLKEILLNLGDQQFFDFCMQQSHFPGSISELRCLCKKLGIYDRWTFSIHRDNLFGFEKCRKRIANQAKWSETVDWSMVYTDPVFSALHAKKTLKTIRYFGRPIVEFDDFASENTLVRYFLRWINWPMFVLRRAFGVQNGMLDRLFRFVSVLQQLSIRAAAPNKECIVASSGTIIVYLKDDMLGVLGRRAGFMKNVKCLKVANFPRKVELKFPNPEKLVWVEILDSNALDLTGNNMSWILEHPNIAVLILISRKLLVGSESFKKLGQLKDLRGLFVYPSEMPNDFSTLEHKPSMEIVAADDHDHIEPINLSEMEKLYRFEMVGSASDSLSFTRMPELREFF